MIQRVEAGRELGQGALGDLGKALPDLIKQGVTEIYLDTTRVVEFDSGTLEAALEFEALAKSRGLTVSIVTPSSLLAIALAITGIMDRISVVDATGAQLSSADIIDRSFLEGPVGGRS